MYEVKSKPPVIFVSGAGNKLIERTGSNGGGGGAEHEESLDRGVAVEGRHCDSWPVSVNVEYGQFDAGQLDSIVSCQTTLQVRAKIFRWVSFLSLILSFPRYSPSPASHLSVPQRIRCRNDCWRFTTA